MYTPSGAFIADVESPPKLTARCTGPSIPPKQFEQLRVLANLPSPHFWFIQLRIFPEFLSSRCLSDWLQHPDTWVRCAFRKKNGVWAGRVSLRHTRHGSHFPSTSVDILPLTDQPADHEKAGKAATTRIIVTITGLLRPCGRHIFSRYMQASGDCLIRPSSHLRAATVCSYRAILCYFTPRL